MIGDLSKDDSMLGSKKVLLLDDLRDERDFLGRLVGAAKADKRFDEPLSRGVRWVITKGP